MLTLSACYMSDRQVSIRLGKGFWSRGPIPSINWRAADFPSLQVQALGSDNLALLFQAQLELIQLFSNAHDILYSSSSHRKQLYMGGEYIRYIVRRPPNMMKHLGANCHRTTLPPYYESGSCRGPTAPVCLPPLNRLPVTDMNFQSHLQ